MKHLGYRWAWILAVVAILLPQFARAQQESSSAQSQPAEPGSRQSDGSSPVQAGATPGAGSEVPEVRQLGKAGPLLPEFSSLRWGPVYVRSIEFIQTADSISFAGQEAGLRRVASVFRTNIAYDHTFRRSRLAIQYQPRVALVNGRVERNFANHNLSFDSYYRLTRRWTLGVSDELSYYRNRILFDENINLDLNLTTGRFLQKYFLDSSGSWLSNTTQFNFSYQMSPRTRFSIAPSYTYANAREVSAIFESHRYGATVSLDRILSGTKSLGVFYTLQQANFSRDLANTRYQTFGVSYSQRISPTWRVSAIVGASVANSHSGSMHWTANGVFSLAKAFRSSSLAFAYSRDYSLGSYLHNTYSDRLDVTYSRTLTRRLEAGVGAGYYRQIWSPASTAGTYGTAQIAYRLSSRVSWFVSYAHKTQHGNNTLVLAGKRDFLATGIRWNPSSPR